MRLQLIGPPRRLSWVLSGLFLVATAFCLGPKSVAAQAESRVEARTSVYSDSDRTDIWTSTVSATAAVGELWTVRARALADVISSASVDVRSSASVVAGEASLGFEEVRKEAEGSIGYSDGTAAISVGYIYSVEDDWRSHTVNAGGSHDFLNHNLTLGFGASFVDNTIWRATGDTNGVSLDRTLLGVDEESGLGGPRVYDEKMKVAGGSLSLVVVEGPDDIWSFNYTLSHAWGYQESPYRFARIAGAVVYGADLGCGRGLPTGECHPDHRTRHGLTVQHNHHMFADSALRSHMRVYGDDWGVLSLTIGTEYVVGFGGLEVAGFVRGYGQRHAAFYADVYSRRQRYMTADRELSTFYDGFAGLRTAYRLEEVGIFKDLHAEVKVVGFGFKFTEFRRLPSRTGLIGELALGAVF